MTSSAGRNAMLKKYLADLDARIAALEEQLCETKKIADASLRRTERTCVQPSIDTVTRTEGVLLRSHMHAAEDAVMVAEKRAEDLARGHEMCMKVAGDMFRAMHLAEYPFKQAQLSLVHVQTLIGTILLRSGQYKLPVCKFLSDVHELYGERGYGMVTREALEAHAATLRKRNATWT